MRKFGVVMCLLVLLVQVVLSSADAFTMEDVKTLYEMTEDDYRLSALEIIDTYYTDDELENISRQNMTYEDLLSTYPTECERERFAIYTNAKTYELIYRSRDSVLSVIYEDRDVPEFRYHLLEMRCLKSEFEDLEIGKTSIYDVMMIDPTDSAIFNLAGASFPHPTVHYTKDGFIVTIEYDMEGFAITKIGYQLI